MERYHFKTFRYLKTFRGQIFFCFNSGEFCEICRMERAGLEIWFSLYWWKSLSVQGVIEIIYESIAPLKTVYSQLNLILRHKHFFCLLVSTRASDRIFNLIFSKKFDQLETLLTLQRPKKALSAGSLCGSLVPIPQSKRSQKTFILPRKYQTSFSNMLS